MTMYIPILPMGGGDVRVPTVTSLLVLITLSITAYATPEMCKWTPEDCRNSSLYNHGNYSIHCFEDAFIGVRRNCEEYCGKPPYSRSCFNPPDRGYCGAWVNKCASRTTPATPTESLPVLSIPDVNATIAEKATTSKLTHEKRLDQSNSTNNNTKDVTTTDLTQVVVDKNQTEDQAKDAVVTTFIPPHSHKEPDITNSILIAFIVLLALVVVALFIVIMKMYCSKRKGSELRVKWVKRQENEGARDQRDDIEQGPEPQEGDNLLPGSHARGNADGHGASDTNGAETSEGSVQFQYPPPFPQRQLSVTSESGEELEDKLRPLLKDDSVSAEVRRICEDHLIGRVRQFRRRMSSTSESTTLPTLTEVTDYKKLKTRIVGETLVSGDDLKSLALKEEHLTGPMVTALAKAAVEKLKSGNHKVKVVAADEKLCQLPQDLLDKQDVLFILRNPVGNGEDNDFAQHYLLIVELKAKLIHVCDSSTRTIDESALEAEKRILVQSIPIFKEFQAIADRITVDKQSDVVNSGVYVIRFVEAYLTALNEDKYQIDGEAGYYLQLTMTPEAYRMQLLEQLGTQNS